MCIAFNTCAIPSRQSMQRDSPKSGEYEKKLIGTYPYPLHSPPLACIRMRMKIHRLLHKRLLAITGTQKLRAHKTLEIPIIEHVDHAPQTHADMCSAVHTHVLRMD